MERLDCDICIAEQAKVSELEEQRPTKCVVQIKCGATADDHELSQAVDVCGQAWRQTIMARRVGSMHLPTEESQSLQRKPIEPVRFHCAPSTVHLQPSLPVSHEEFQDGMNTFPVFQRHGDVDDNTRFHTHMWKGAPNTLLLQDTLLRLLRLEMDDLTRRQPRRVMLERRLLVCVGTNFEQHGRHPCLWNKFRYTIFHHNLRRFRNLCIRTAPVLDKAWITPSTFWKVSTTSLASMTSLLHAAACLRANVLSTRVTRMSVWSVVEHRGWLARVTRVSLWSVVENSLEICRHDGQALQ